MQVLLAINPTLPPNYCHFHAIYYYGLFTTYQHCFHGRGTITTPTPYAFYIGTNTAPAANFVPISKLNTLIPKEPSHL